jgi:hypothetical protein
MAARTEASVLKIDTDGERLLFLAKSPMLGLVQLLGLGVSVMHANNRITSLLQFTEPRSPRLQHRSQEVRLGREEENLKS